MKEFRVLIVDDELDFLETIVKRLKRRQVDATGIDSGIKALELLEKEHFDVVILDVRMPGLDGIETLKEMKKKRPLLEVIMLTGHASVESGVQGMQYGAFDYVMKPADINDLLEKIKAALERKALHEEKVRESRMI
jgi:two-component system OmpR family response regulator